jgi:hypothetical protein
MGYSVVVGRLCLAMLLGLFACSAEQSYGRDSDSHDKQGPGFPPPINLDPPHPGWEHLVIDSLADDSWRFEQGGGDPCSCSDQDCREDWVSEHLGCDLCVTLLCRSSDVHVCTRCP